MIIHNPFITGSFSQAPGNSYFLGNLAVGKESPSVELDILGNTYISGSLFVSNSIQTDFLTANGNITGSGNLFIGGAITGSGLYIGPSLNSYGIYITPGNTTTIISSSNDFPLSIKGYQGSRVGINLDARAGGDPLLVFSKNGTGLWNSGMDNTSLDYFIGTGALVGTVPALQIDYTNKNIQIGQPAAIAAVPEKLTIEGSVSASGNFYIDGNADLGGILSVTGSTSISSSLYVNETITVGSGGGSISVDPVITIHRLVTGSDTNNAHAFVDATLIDKSGSIGYNSFDARGKFTGTHLYDHYAGFQASFTYSSSGVMDNLYNYISVPVINAGSITNVYGAYTRDAVGTGEAANVYGYYSLAPSFGTASNYHFMGFGEASSSFGGKTTIGTNTPSAYTLEVVGNQQIRYTTGSGADMNLLTLHRKGSVGVGDLVSMDFKLGTVDVSYAKIGASIHDQWDGYLTFHTTTTGLGGLQENMRLDHNGNLGIGTTTPDEKLTVEGAISSSGRIYTQNGVTMNSNQAFKLGDSTLPGYGSDIGEIYNIGGIFAIEADNIRDIKIGSTTYPNSIYVEGTNGNVGIGNNITPSYPLDVSGSDIRLIDQGVNANISFLLTNDVKTWSIVNQGSSGDRFVINNITDGYAPFVIYPDSLSNTIFVRTSNVRIGGGTSVPPEKLTVEGNISASGDLYFSGNLISDNDIVIDGDLEVTGMITAQEFHAEFVSSSIIYESGSTKFGDTADDIHQMTGSFYIQGPIEAKSGNIIISGSDSQELLLKNAGSVETPKIHFRGFTNDSYLYQNSAGHFQIGVESIDPAFTISSAGNLGIGNSSPNEALTVEGSISASGDLFINNITAEGDLEVTGSFTLQSVGSSEQVVYQVRNTTTGATGTKLSTAGSFGQAFIIDLDAEDNSTFEYFQIRYDGAETQLELNRFGDLFLYSGSLGINGTKNTPQALTVQGNISASGGAYITGNTLIGPYNSNIPEKLTVDGNISSSGDLYLGGSDIYFAGIKRIDFASHTYYYGEHTNTGHRFLTHDGGTDLMYIGQWADPNVYVLNKLGVGTISVPNEELTVEGSISASGDLYINDIKISRVYEEAIDTEVRTIASLNTGSYTAGFFDYYANSGSNYRAGTVQAVWDETNIQYNETSTDDIGDTSDVVLSVELASSNASLIATTTSDDWTVKALARGL